MTDVFPMYQKGVFDYPMAMALATLLGVGFGFALERAGFGRATILAAQFYNTNMRVLKVMFSAIATTTVGLGLLGGLGVVDLTALSIPATFIWPQLVGGGLLGMGFVISGYCPGTAVVATASGNVDAVISLLGIMIGSLAFGFAYPAFESLYLSGSMGTPQLHTMMGVPWSVVAVAVAVMAMGAFVGGEALERMLARKHGTEPPASDPATRKRFFVGLGVFAAAGLATAALGPQLSQPAVTPIERIDAATLADQLIQDPEGLFVVDLRPAADCAAKRIPGALCLPEGDAKAFFASLPATRTLVLYEAGDAKDLPAEIMQFEGKKRSLTGGYQGFVADVLTKPATPTEATPEAIAAWEKANAVYAFFSGVKAAPPPKMPARKVIKRAVRKGGGC